MKTTKCLSTEALSEEQINLLTEIFGPVEIHQTNEPTVDNIKTCSFEEVKKQVRKLAKTGNDLGCTVYLNTLESSLRISSWATTFCLKTMYVFAWNGKEWFQMSEGFKDINVE